MQVKGWKILVGIFLPTKGPYIVGLHSTFEQWLETKVEKKHKRERDREINSF